MDNLLKELNRELNNDEIKACDIKTDLIIGYTGFYNKYVKRVIGFALSITLIIFTSPLLLITALLIYLEDGSPVFYCAERGGYQGRIFKIIKFRSMVKNADSIGGGTTSLNDDRITKVGKIIRKFKIDELPNLLNILKGEMCFIGPRPELLRYTTQYKGSEKCILMVRPGITDFSSVEFINLDEIVGSGNADQIYEAKVLPLKNKLRVKYVAIVSFKIDFKLFVLTIWKVLEKLFEFLLKGKHR